MYRTLSQRLTAFCFHFLAPFHLVQSKLSRLIEKWNRKVYHRNNPVCVKVPRNAPIVYTEPHKTMEVHNGSINHETENYDLFIITKQTNALCPQDRESD